MSYVTEFLPLPYDMLACDPEFIGWTLIQPGGPVQADLAPLRKDAHSKIPRCVLRGPPYQRWRRGALQPPEVLQLRQERDTYVHVPE